MLLIGIWIAFIAAIGLSFSVKDAEKRLGIRIGAGLIMTITMAIVLGTMLNSTTESVELETFYDTNQQNFTILVENSQAIISTDDFNNKMVSGSLEKQSIATSVVEIMKRRIDSVNAYNLKLANHRMWQNNWAGKYIIIPVRDDLKPIIIK